MGVDLTLIRDRHHSLGNWFIGYDRISVDRDYDVLGQIGDIGRGHEGNRIVNAWQLPPGTRFDSYEDEGILTVTDDPYGDPLTYTTAGELAKVRVGESTPWNRALWEAIRALPADTVFVLWWH